MQLALDKNVPFVIILTKKEESVMEDFNKSAVRGLRNVLKRTQKDYKILTREFDNIFKNIVELFGPFWNRDKKDFSFVSDSFMPLDSKSTENISREVSKGLIRTLNERTGYRFDEDGNAKRMFDLLFKKKKLLEGEYKKSVSLISALKNDSIEDVTYSLPFVVLSVQDSDGTIGYLVAKGIKINVANKPENGEFIDSLEKDLMVYERRLDGYIGEDYYVKLEDMEDFIETFLQYIDTYYETLKQVCSYKYDYSRIRVQIIVMMALYILRGRLDVRLKDDEYMVFRDVFVKMSSFEGMTAGRVVATMLSYIVERSEKLMVEYEDSPESLEVSNGAFAVNRTLAREELANILGQFEYTSQETEKLETRMEEAFKTDGAFETICSTEGLELLAMVVACRKLKSREMPDEKKNIVQAESNRREDRGPRFDLLEGWVENGRVVRVGEEEAFAKLLDEAGIDELRKEEFMRQMSNLKGRLAQEKLKQMIDENRNKILTTRELELYELAKTNPATTQTVKDIDAVVEMMIGEEDEENKAVLVEEMKPLFEFLEAMFPRRDEKNEDTSKPIIYFTREIDGDGDEKIEVPRLLVSLRVDKGLHYKQANGALEKLLCGNLAGDREVRGTGLPCRLWAKGGDYKLFYTLMGEVIVVVDGHIGNDEGYVYIGKVVRSSEFGEFLDKVKMCVSSGEVPRAKGYTHLLKSELEERKTSKKKKFKM